MSLTDEEVNKLLDRAVRAEVMVLKLAGALEDCAHLSAELRERMEYFRASRDKNGEALDRARAALTEEQKHRDREAVAADNEIARLTKAIHAALAHDDRTPLGTVRKGLADAVNVNALTLHVCGGTQARICPVTKQPHDMSAVRRGEDWESVACKDCGATAMDMDLLEGP